MGGVADPPDGGYTYTYNEGGGIETATNTSTGQTVDVSTGETLNPYATGYGITYPADAWQGWAKEIQIHSGGLEIYTAPTSPGQPGITELTQAGREALGLAPGQSGIQTYSWGAPIERVIVPLRPGAVTLGALDFTPLANLILEPINTALVPIYNVLQDIITWIKETAGAALQGVTDTVGGLVQSVLGAINSVGMSVSALLDDIGRAVSGVINPAIEALEAGVNRIKDLILADLAGLGADIQDVKGDLAGLRGLPDQVGRLVALFTDEGRLAGVLAGVLVRAWDMEVA